MNILISTFSKKINSILSVKFCRIMWTFISFLLTLEVVNYLFDKNFSSPMLYILLVIDMLFAIPLFIYNRRNH